MVIDNTYFMNGGPYYIAQISTAPVQAIVTGCIDQYEPEYLRVMLGEELYNAMVAECFTDPAPDPLPARWLALFNGADYNGAGLYPHHWDGLRSKFASPIMSYVYFRYLGRQGDMLAGVGVVVSAAENATRTPSTRLQSVAWNDMVRRNKELWAYLTANAASFPEWKPQEFYYNPLIIRHDTFRFGACRPSEIEQFFTTINALNL